MSVSPHIVSEPSLYQLENRLSDVHFKTKFLIALILIADASQIGSSIKSVYSMHQNVTDWTAVPFEAVIVMKVLNWLYQFRLLYLEWVFKDSIVKNSYLHQILCTSLRGLFIGAEWVLLMSLKLPENIDQNSLELGESMATLCVILLTVVLWVPYSQKMRDHRCITETITERFGPIGVTHGSPIANTLV